MGRRERPLAPGPLHDFAYDLRELRAGTGLTYRALGHTAGYTPSALSAAASGDSLPTPQVLRAYVRACGGDPGKWEERRRTLGALLHRTDPGLLPTEHSDGAADAPTGTSRPAESSPDQEPLPDQKQSPSPPDGLAFLTASDPRLVGSIPLAARLGVGAMGQVYLGRATTGEPAAVKIIRAELADDKGFRRRFRRELDALTKVRSPFISPVTGGDAAADRPWLATAYTPAITLADAVGTCGPLPPGAVRQLAAAISSALSVIHREGIVHRDLKPSNVLLTADSAQVIDFGIACMAEGTILTAAGAHVGNAAYMAPEQATGTTAAAPADVFALGSLLVYALTGKAPFGEGHSEAVLYRIIHDPPDLAAVDALTSEDNNLDNLRELIRACLSKDPAARPTAVSIADRYPGAVSSPEPGWLPAPAAALVSRHASDAAVALSALPSSEAQPSRRQRRKGRINSRPVKFGLGPLILAGAIIISFTILRGTGSYQTLKPPHKTGPSFAQPVPDPTPRKQHSPKAASPVVAAGGQAQSADTARPSPSTAPPANAPQQAAPALLGAPDFNGYCQVTGQGSVQLISAAHAYGWQCSAASSTGDNAEAVCAWTFQLPASEVTNSVQDFYDPGTWQCWRITQQLSPPNWNGYCQATGHGAGTLNSQNAYGWHCADGSGIDANAACEWTNDTSSMISRFQNFYDPQSWECWR